MMAIPLDLSVSKVGVFISDMIYELCVYLVGDLGWETAGDRYLLAGWRHSIPARCELINCGRAGTFGMDGGVSSG
jgi:hypothetical protein